MSPGSIRGTARTRRWAPSGRTSRSGASGAGDRGRSLGPAVRGRAVRGRPNLGRDVLARTVFGRAVLRGRIALSGRVGLQGRVAWRRLRGLVEVVERLLLCRRGSPAAQAPDLDAQPDDLLGQRGQARVVPRPVVR